MSIRQLLLIVAIVLLVLALVCLLSPTTIAGANWAAWLVSALISWMLGELVSGAGIVLKR